MDPSSSPSATRRFFGRGKHNRLENNGLRAYINFDYIWHVFLATDRRPDVEVTFFTKCDIYVHDFCTSTTDYTVVVNELACTPGNKVTLSVVPNSHYAFTLGSD